MSVDRRRGIRDRRVALRVPAVFAVKSLVRGRLQLGQAEDIGPGGLTVRRLPDISVPPGSAITLTFALPGGGPMVRVTGQVMSDQLTGAGTFRRTGVRFANLPAEAQQRIARFCAAQLGSLEAGDEALASTG